MPAMQLGLDELINMMMIRMANNDSQCSQFKTTLNIVIRLLYKKKIIDRNDIKESIKNEFELMMKIGQIKEMPNEDFINGMTEEMVQWAEGNDEFIIKAMKEYENQVNEMMQKSKNKIDIASASDLTMLDNVMKNAPKGSKLIISPFL